MSLRFGLGGEEFHPVANGRQINVFRERVRQLESKAISNLKLMKGSLRGSIDPPEPKPVQGGALP